MIFELGTIKIDLSESKTTEGCWCTSSWMCHHTHTHSRSTALCPGPPGWAGTRKVKQIWLLLKQETVSGSGISWAICKSTSIQTDNHVSTPPLSFLQAGCPSCRPTNSVKALKAKWQVEWVINKNLSKMSAKQVQNVTAITMLLQQSHWNTPNMTDKSHYILEMMCPHPYTMTNFTLAPCWGNLSPLWGKNLTLKWPLEHKFVLLY